MRWGCPHCGVTLAVADEKLGSGWSFSKCYKCGGFALVRKAEANLVKVDKAPVGENVLLPEGSETPVLSTEATRNLENLISRARETNATPPAPPSAPSTEPVNANAAENQIPQFLTQTPQNREAPLAIPQIVGVSTKARYRLLPVAIGVTGSVAVASGIYLYVQGQAIWNKINPPPIVASAAPVSHEIISDQLQQIAMAPDRSITETLARETTQPVAQPKDETTNDGDDVESAITVRVKVDNSKLRAGPGLSFRIVGYANPATEYVVLEWRDRWFKIGPKTAENAAQYAAWIRNDLVEPISQQD